MAKFKRSNNFSNLIYYFKNIKLVVDFDEDCQLTASQRKDVKQIVKEMSKQIYIDKSYVQFDENKHDDVFITYDGWNDFQQLLEDTNYGKKTTPEQDETIDSALFAMVYGYMCQIIDMFYPNQDGILLSFKENSGLYVEFLEDNVEEWKHYPGKWQDWEKFD